MRVHGTLCAICEEEILAGDDRTDISPTYRTVYAHTICFVRREARTKLAAYRRRKKAIKTIKQLAIDLLPLAVVTGVLWGLNQIASGI